MSAFVGAAALKLCIFFSLFYKVRVCYVTEKERKKERKGLRERDREVGEKFLGKDL